VRVAIGIPPCRSLDELAEVARRAEEAGFDTVAFADSPTLYRDTFLAMAFAAHATNRVTVTSWVSNFATRDPIEFASAGRSIAELAPGRLRISVGAGDSSTFLTGNVPSTTAELRTGLETVRDLMAGRPARIGGTEVVLHGAAGPVPIYLAANGPRNLALAGEVADGVLVWRGELGHKAAAVAAAAARAGREPPPICVSSGTVKVTDDAGRDARRLKPYVLHYAQRATRDELESIGFAGPLPDGNVLLPDGSDFGHPRDLDAAVEFASRWISDDFALWYATHVCCFGTAEAVAERLLAFAAEGVDEVQVTAGTPFDTPDDLIDQMGAGVLARVHAREGTTSAPEWRRPERSGPPECS